MSSQYLLLAEHYDDLGQFEKVLGQLEYTPEDDLSEPLYWQLRTRALYALGYMDEAHDAALQGLEIGPENINLQLFYARIQTHQGNFAEAEASFQHLLTLAPDEPIALTSYAWCLMRQTTFWESFTETKRRAKLRALLGRALELDPNHRETLRSQLRFAERIQDKAAIRHYTERLLREDPEDASAHAALGDLHLEQKRLLSASRHFQTAAHTTPEDESVTQKARAHSIPEHPLLPAWLFNGMSGIYVVVALIAISWTALLFLDVFSEEKHAFLAFGLPYGCFALYYALTPQIIKRLRRRRD